MRQDSLGSVSSLDRSITDDENSFFDRLLPKHQSQRTAAAPKKVRSTPSSPLSSPRQRLHTMDRPPASRGGHRRLNSIENDDWSEPGGEEQDEPPQQHWRRREEVSPPPDERTHLLPPSGISTNEDSDRYRATSSSGVSRGSSGAYFQEESSRVTDRVTNTTAMAIYQFEMEQAERARRKKRRKKKKKKKRRRQARRKNQGRGDDSVSSSSTSSDSSLEFNRWLDERSSFLEEEKARVVERWKAEARAEFEASKRRERRPVWGGACAKLVKRFVKVLAYLESFFANLPLTIGAIALSIANLGVDWFKFMEENLDSCQPVHFHSEQCTFPEVGSSIERR